MLMRKVPKGRFTLDTKSGRTNHLLVSTVTGVAPFVSYVRTLYKDWKEGKFAGEHKLFLLNGASRSWEFGYLDELRQVRRGSSLADIRPHRQPPLGRSQMDRRNRPGRRSDPQVHRHVGAERQRTPSATCAAIPR